MGWSKRWGKRLRLLVRRDEVERELDEELAFHLDMEARKNVRAGMSPAEARRQAAIAFGGVERHKEEVRDARVLGWVSGVSLDLKLGARMLAKFPGLTVVGGLAMAFAIAVGAGTFELVTQVVHPRLPLEDGERIVGIRTWDAAAAMVQERGVAGDLAAWREEVESIQDLSAARGFARNLIVPGGPAVPVMGAEMSASGFRVARVPPLLGRHLLEEDEREDAPPVVVLGHELWQTHFGGEPAVVGREVRLGNTVYTVVGVMPPDFGFPVAHRLWVPLRPAALDHAPGEGPEVAIFGRLAPGSTARDARAELSALAQRAAAASPETHGDLQRQVVPFATMIVEVPWRYVTAAGYSTKAGVLLFLLLVCANVATLVFARTATRESELVVRSALGASRGRIVLQLFAEALVLGGIAAALGLVAAAFGLRWGIGVFETVQGELPFWINDRLAPRTVLYAGFLAVLAAAVSGVVPALKLTGGDGEARLRQAAVGGSSVRFGRLWTGIIVTQVAITAAFVPIVADAGLATEAIRATEAGFPAEEYLSARLMMDSEAVPGTPAEAARAAADERLGATYEELKRRLTAEPGVVGVTFGSQIPGAYHPRRVIEVDGEAVPPRAGRDPKVQTASVAPDFFDALATPVLSGRGFRPEDVEAGRYAVVVNESFVREILGDRNPIGRRVRFPEPQWRAERTISDEPGPWYEIVGVVRDVIMTINPDLDHNAGIYHPAAPTGEVPLRIVAHVRGDPSAFAPRLRELATAVDPALRLYEVKPVDEARDDLLMTYLFWVRIAALACAVVLLLSVLGIYSIMSFTVARRTREIGIRIALGADRRRVIGAVFSRAFRQVGFGIALGILLLIALAGGIHSLRVLGLLAGSAGLMVAAVVVACIVPTRRAFGIQPTEAIKAE